MNEVLAVLLMAKKCGACYQYQRGQDADKVDRFGVPVVPHSGGIGLNEYTQHLSLVDYLCVSGTQSMLENISTYNHVLTKPLQTRDGFFVTPSEFGYSVEFQKTAVAEFTFPHGTFWRSGDGKSIISGELN